MHTYEVRPRKDHRGVDLISDALPYGGLSYGGPNAVSNAIGYAKHRSRAHRAVIRVYDEAGSVIASFQARAPDGCRFPDRRSAIPLSFEAFEPALQTPRNIQERIQTTSESRRVRQYHGYDKAAV